MNFFLLHFYKWGRTKYTLKSLLLYTVSAMHTPIHACTSTSIQWGRFINTKGKIGKKIPCDLQNEHVNRIFKEAIANVGSNFTEYSTTRIACSVTFLEKIAQQLDEQC